MKCQRPDRDVPKLTCGYSLPCPWHTVTIDASADPPTVTTPITVNVSPVAAVRVRRIAKALRGE